MWTNLCDIYQNATLDYRAIYMGIPLDPLLRTFRHRTLELIKLLLLEKKVCTRYKNAKINPNFVKIIFEIRPTSLLCDILTALISLFPCMLAFFN